MYVRGEKCIESQSNIVEITHYVHTTRKFGLLEVVATRGAFIAVSIS